MNNNEIMCDELYRIAVKKIFNYDDRPVIIFLHDSFGCIQLWRDFPEKLGILTKCNVIVYDRLGYGKSQHVESIERDNSYLEKEADFLNKLIEEWNLKDVILFGHSDGGSIALLTASKYPEKISGVLTVGAHVFVEDITVNGVKQGIEEYENGNLKSKLEKYHKENTDFVFWSWGKTWTSEKFRTWNIESFLPKIKCPVFAVQGANDEYGTLKQVESIVNNSSGYSESFIVENAGHTPYKEKPEIVLEKSSDFIWRHCLHTSAK